MSADRPYDGPAHDEAAERIVLGAMMTSPSAVETVTDVPLTSSDWYAPIHETLFTHIVAAWVAGDPTEPVALARRLAAAGDLDRIGGLPYLHTLIASVPTIANTGFYARIVADTAQQRRLHTLGLKLTQLASDPDTSRRTDHLAAITTELAGGTRRTTPRTTPLDWTAFLTEDFGDPEWIPGKLMTRGQQIALVGEAKAGKSLLCLDWAWRCAAGRPFLGDIARPPLRVLYIDQENDHGELQNRLHALGATPGDLTGLIYLSFPAFRPLNTPAGARDLLDAARDHRAEIVILDTISRMIAGAEKDPEPWNDLYRHTMLPLKRAGISSIRLDHFGKDKTLGARGSSAKSTDVDHVWELHTLDRADGLLTLTRSYTRSGTGLDELTIRRHGVQDGDRWKPGGTFHAIAATDTGEPATPWKAAQTIADRLDDAGTPRGIGRDKTRDACQRLGIKARNETIADVVKLRKTVDAQ